MTLKIFSLMFLVFLVSAATAGCTGGIRLNEREAVNPAGQPGNEPGEDGTPGGTKETGTVILKGRVLEPTPR